MKTKLIPLVTSLIILFFCLKLISSLSAVYAGFSIAEKPVTLLPPVKANKIHLKLSAPQRVPKTGNPELETLKRIEEKNAKIDALLEQYGNNNITIDNTSSFDLKTGTALEGILLNSVVSTNLNSPVLVKVLPNKYVPDNTKFACQGTTANKRVIVACHKMITDIDEYAVQVSLLNPDGSAGLKGSYYDGKETLFLSSMAQAFAQGVISVAQTKNATALGEITQNTTQNQLLQGLANSGTKATELITEDVMKQSPTVLIPSGIKVILYFQERFKI